MRAAQYGQTDIVNALIEKNAKVDAVDKYVTVWCKINGMTALTWAAEKGHKEIVNALITAGANVNATGR